MTSAREKMLQQSLRLLVIDLKNRATERGIEYPQFAMECAEAALALPADDDVGSARTADVPGTGACICAGAGTCLYCIAVRVLNEHLGSAGVALLTGHTALSNAAPVTNARDGRASDNNGEARDAELRNALRGMRINLGCLVGNPVIPSENDWPCENEADRWCLQQVWGFLEDAHAAIAAQKDKP